MTRFCFLCIVRLFMAASVLMALNPRAAEAKRAEMGLTPITASLNAPLLPKSQIHEISVPMPMGPEEENGGRPEAEEVVDKTYVQSGRWIGDLYQYKTDKGLWLNASQPRIATEAGKVPGTETPYKKGDIVFRVGNKWYKARPDAKVISLKEPSEDTVPNPWNVELDPYFKQVVHFTNLHRMKMGLAPFKVDPALMSQARTKSQAVANSARGGDVNAGHHELAPHYGYNRENIANGNLSAEALVNMWINSAGHRAAIEDASKNTLGVGWGKSHNGVAYHTQLMGVRKDFPQEMAETKSTEEKISEKMKGGS